MASPMLDDDGAVVSATCSQDSYFVQYLDKLQDRLLGFITMYQTRLKLLTSARQAYTAREIFTDAIFGRDTKVISSTITG